MPCLSPPASPQEMSNPPNVSQPASSSISSPIVMGGKSPPTMKFLVTGALPLVSVIRGFLQEPSSKSATRWRLPVALGDER